MDIDPLHVAFEHSLDSVFHTFLVLEDHDLLLSQHEIGVVALNTEGREIWRFARDVITSLRIETSVLHLGFMDSPPASIRLRDGTAES